MTSGIERAQRIDPAALSGEYYFGSLLEQARRLGLLTDEALDRCQAQTLSLLQEKIRDYTGGSSSSVRTAVGESLMASNLYTVGLALKQYPTPDDALTALGEVPLRELYLQGRKRIDTKLKTARTFYGLALRNRTVTENRTYNETLEGGFPGFARLYTPDFAAQEIHITADYPLACPVTDLAGVEFMQQYLERWRLENDFCVRFLPETIHQLFLGYNKDYPELIFNLFQQLLTSALGCVLGGADPLSLDLSSQRTAVLQATLAGRSRAELEAAVKQAWTHLKEELAITSPLLERYILSALPAVTADLANAVKLGALERVLPPLA